LQTEIKKYLTTAGSRKFFREAQIKNLIESRLFRWSMFFEVDV